jgi:hypothetical protein
VVDTYLSDESGGGGSKFVTVNVEGHVQEGGRDIGGWWCLERGEGREGGREGGG